MFTQESVYSPLFKTFNLGNFRKTYDLPFRSVYKLTNLSKSLLHDPKKNRLLTSSEGSVYPYPRETPGLDSLVLNHNPPQTGSDLLSTKRNDYRVRGDFLFQVQIRTRFQSTPITSFVWICPRFPQRTTCTFYPWRFLGSLLNPVRLGKVFNSDPHTWPLLESKTCSELPNTLLVTINPTLHLFNEVKFSRLRNLLEKDEGTCSIPEECHFHRPFGRYSTGSRVRGESQYLSSDVSSVFRFQCGRR